MNSLSPRFGHRGLALLLLASLTNAACSASPGSTEDEASTASAILPVKPIPGPVFPISPGPSGCQTPSAITDWGYPGFREYADVNGDTFLDYCRMVGDAPNIFLSCELGCRSSGYSATYSYASPPGIDQGYAGTGQMIDVNGDKRADFCRTVGDAPNTFSACDLAIAGGFGADTFEISYPVGFAPSAPIGTLTASDGTTIDEYQGPSANWLHGKDTVGVKHDLTLGTSGSYVAMSIVENGASIIALSMMVDKAGYLTIYAKSPALTKSYRFLATPSNLAASPFSTDFAPALEHFAYFSPLGQKVGATLLADMKNLGIDSSLSGSQLVTRLLPMGAWAVDAFTAAAIVLGPSSVLGGSIPTFELAVLALSTAPEGVVMADPGVQPDPFNPDPVPSGDEPPPSNVCGPDEDCTAPTTPPDDGSGDDGSGGAGGSNCNPGAQDFPARHAQWAKAHPADICVNCCA